MKRLVFLLLILALVGGSAFAFDWHSFPSPIEKGDLLISPLVGIGIHWGSGWTSDLGGGLGLAIPVAIEYALPINFALSVGGEVGLGMGFKDGGGTILAIPMLAKVAWHPNFEINNLDLYYTIKMGFSIGIWTGMSDPFDKFYKKVGAGFAFGTDIGVRYFFTEKFAINGEVGFDNYAAGFKGKGGWAYGNHRGMISTFTRIGVTFKI